MDQNRWQRIEAIYYAVLDASPEQRGALLREACDGDRELQAEVESLLSARSEAGDFLAPETLRAAVAGLAVGSEIGPYRIESELGAGAMGEVYRAIDTRLERPVALKILPSRFMHDSGRLARFRTEARAASALNHPNIVAIYEIGETGGLWFLAQEFVEGGTLRARLASGPVALTDAIAIGVQCADALAAAHGAGIVHRDIKPENIMLRADGVVKLVDFGLARVTQHDPDGSADTTEPGTIMGTPRYMSPEQARGAKADARSDLFSLGAVLYELLHGKPAVAGETPAEVFGNLLHTPPPFDGGAADSVLRKALERDAANRYASMQEFREALRGIGARRGGAAKYVWASMAVVALGSFLWWKQPAPAPPSAPLTLVPLTTVPGLKDFAALSPDGARVAFSWNGGKEGLLNRAIFVKPTGDGEAVRLTEGDVDDIRPAWSPDGSEIAFLRRTPRGLSAMIVSSKGGAARQVAENSDGVAWSPDGGALALAGPTGIYALTLASDRRLQITAPDGARDYSPAYSPDGKWIAFYREVRGEPEVYVAPAQGGAARQLSFDTKPKSGISWTPDSREVIYSTRRETGGSGIWRVPVAGGEARSLSDALQFAGNPQVALRANRLAYTESWTDNNLYSFVVAASGALGNGQRIAASSREDHSPSFSRDGQRIAFISNRSGNSEVWTARADGTNQKQITNMKLYAGTPRWSPDGKWITFDNLVRGQFGLYIVAAEGGEPRRVLAEAGQTNKGSWSPDGQWIYFNSNRSGKFQMWAVHPDGSGARQITKGGAREAHLSPDGRTVYFTRDGSGSAIWRAPAEGGEETLVEEIRQYDRIGRAWGVTDEGIYFVSAEAGAAEQAIRLFAFGSKTVRVLRAWQSKTAWTGPALAMPPDGKALIVVQTDQQLNDLMMIENFK